MSKLKDWWSTVVGLIVLAIVSIASIITIYQSTGISNRQTLSSSDNAIVSATGTSDASQEEALVLSKPVRIIIPSVNIGIDVLDSSIDVSTNEWPLSADKVHYANFTSSLGNERGTLLMYGHNSWPVLRNTADLKIGNEMIVSDENGKDWKFVYYKEEIITPEQVGFIYEDVPFRIVMFTCNGWADQYRRLMFFQPV